MLEIRPENRDNERRSMPAAPSSARDSKPRASRTPAPTVKASSHLMEAAFLLALTAFAYAPVTRCAFIWDDDDYVTRNQVVQSPAGLGRIWFDVHATPQYYPLVFTSFWVEHAIWGLHPLGYHLVNIILHALASILLWQILLRLKLPGAWLAGAIFALHPVHVESVAWITERKNVLSGVFALSALLVFVRAFALDSKEPLPHPQVRTYAFGVGLFVCALLSKTVTCFLPVAILLLIWRVRNAVTRREWLLLAPLFAIGAGMGLLTAFIERMHVGAVGEEWNLSFLERFLVAGRVFWFYLFKLVWPVHLVFVYPRWDISAGTWWQYLFPLAAVTLIAVLFAVRNRIGRGPLASVLIFAAGIFPASGFINVFPMRYSFVADHFQYHASMAIIALISAALALAWNRANLRTNEAIKNSKAQLFWPGIPATVLLLTLGLKTAWECGKYRDLESLWRDTLAKNPSAWIAHNNLGTLLKDKGDNVNAVKHLSEAIRLKPDHANAYANLASALIALEQWDQAESNLRKRLQLVPSDAQAHLNLANILAQKGEAREAEVHYREAVRALPNDPVALYSYAIQLAQTNRKDEAIQQLNHCVKANPNWVPAKELLTQLSEGRAQQNE